MSSMQHPFLSYCDPAILLFNFVQFCNVYTRCGKYYLYRLLYCIISRRHELLYEHLVGIDLIAEYHLGNDW